MSHWLNLSKSLALTGCLLSSACATVNMTEMTSTQTEATPQDQNINVVQRAVAKLNDVFRNRGFVEKTSRNKMRAAARVLLTGLESKPLNQDMNYAASVPSQDALYADILFAQKHVEQTKQAAEIYLAMAPGEASLRKELSSLQTALLAANEAKASFSQALELKSLNETDGVFIGYKNAINDLRLVTDAFGVRVRSEILTDENAALGS